MIKLENCEVMGWEHAIRGMRNPMNSWEKSDTGWVDDDDEHADIPSLESDFDWMTKKVIGPNDHGLMMKLAKGGSVHAKYRRMITVYVDITAPLYWWKEFDTYKVGTVANSCSTMHKIHDKEFTLEDFSCEHLNGLHESEKYDADLLMDVSPYKDGSVCFSPAGMINIIVNMLNICRNKYLETKDKKYWWQMIQLLPSSYNQKRTVMLNYEVLAAIYRWRKDHKLDEWCEFCEWIETLPYSEIITGEVLDGNDEPIDPDWDMK